MNLVFLELMRLRATVFTDVLSLSLKCERGIFGSKGFSCFFFRIDESDYWQLWEVVLNFLTIFV